MKLHDVSKDYIFTTENTYFQIGLHFMELCETPDVQNYH